MKRIDIKGQKFGRLTVISIADNIKPKNGKVSYTAWNCLCDCGTLLTVRTNTLRGLKQRSCGCLVGESGRSIKVGEQFYKLTTVSYDAGYWNCLCECGGKAYTSTHSLLVGNAKSCGCLRKERSTENIKKAIKKQTKYLPRIGSARRVWRSYLYRNKNNLQFDRWLEISQQNCFYCVISPHNKYNYFIKRKTSEYNKLNGDFIYNGLDRINNSIGYLEGNVVACCYVCNRAKSDRTLDDFNNYIINLNKNIQEEKELQLPEGYLLTSVKIVYRHYQKNYGKMEIDLSTFYNYSQAPCFYCGMEKSNYFNIYLKDKKASEKAKLNANFYYNGIDRLNNKNGHTKDNIVSCCRYCNFAKGNLDLSEFNNWMIRIKKCQKK